MSEVKAKGFLIREGLAAASGQIYSRKSLEEMLALLPGKPIVWVRDGEIVGRMSNDLADFEIVADEEGQIALVFRNASLERDSPLLRQIMHGIAKEIGIGPEVMARIKGGKIEEVVRIGSVGATVNPDDLLFSSGRVTGFEQGEG